MATNFAKADYQEIVDLHTEAGKVSVIGIHTPQGAKPRQMLVGFFTQFRKYKYKGCDLVMVPASRLPADPLQVSYGAGEPTIDPRDLLNPLLFHGCHGDNLNVALNTIYRYGGMTRESTSVGMDEKTASATAGESQTWEQHYYRAMNDPTFLKRNIMSPLRKKGLHPMVYNVATQHQLAPNEVSADVGQLGYNNESSASNQGFIFKMATRGHVTDGNVVPQFMTNHLTSMGWLDTRQVMNAQASEAGPGLTTLPKIFMGLIMLPPAYKTEMYFRLVLTHHFVFKEFNTSLTVPGAIDYTNWNPPLTKNEEDGKSDSLELVNSTATILTDGVM